MKRLGVPLMGRCRSCGRSVHDDDVSNEQDLDGGSCPFCSEGPVRAVAWGASPEQVEAFAPTRPTGRACIFCGQTPLTREHLWPQWIGRTFADSRLQQQGNQNRAVKRKRTALFGEGYVQIANDERKQRGGSSVDRTIRTVCASCNNGWMADLESQAKPILIRLATDRAAFLHDGEAAVVARWVAKTTAVFEWDDPESAILPRWALEAIASGDDTSLRTHWAVHAAWLYEPAFEMTMGILHGTSDAQVTDAPWSGLLQTIAVNRSGFVVEFDPVGGVFPSLGFEPPRMRPLWPRLDGRRRPRMTREDWRFVEDLGPLNRFLAKFSASYASSHVEDLDFEDEDLRDEH